MNILFALNQDKSTNTEEAIISAYTKATGMSAEYSKEYDVEGIKKTLLTKHYDVVLLNEELERDSTLTTSFIDELTDKYPRLRIILLVASHHEKDAYVKRLFNIGVYDLLYAHDISIDNIIMLMKEPRAKVDAKDYLELDEIEDAFVEDELTIIPDDQLYNILSYFENTEPDKMVSVYEHIYGQYNESQMIYLYRRLPEDIKDQLRGSELFDEIELIAGSLIEYRGDVSGEIGEEVVEEKKRIKTPNINLNINLPSVKFSSNENSVKDKLIGSVFIGIANSSRGAGATYVSIALANYLKSIGHSVAVIEMNSCPVIYNLANDKSNNVYSVDGVDYYYMQKDFRKNEYPIPDFRKNYQYVISDLGMIKEIEDGIYTNNQGYVEFLRSNVKILMINGSLWKWGEVYPFLVDERLSSWTLFVSPTIKKNKSIINKELSQYNKDIYFLPYCEDAFSPSDELIDIFNRGLGEFIGNKSKKKTKFKLQKLQIFGTK